MVLTPEDLFNKRFQTTKFRDGYDQDEVDDFLDEVTEEFRRLIKENEELKQSLVAAESRIAELQRNTGATPSVVATAPAPVAPAPISTADSDESTSSLLQLARKLHEEHVREGIEKRDQLIAEGHQTAARIVEEAEVRSRQLLVDAETQERSVSQRIQDLKTFETQYRQSLKGYIESQLSELNKALNETPSAPAGA